MLGLALLSQNGNGMILAIAAAFANVIVTAPSNVAALVTAVTPPRPPAGDKVTSVAPAAVAGTFAQPVNCATNFPVQVIGGTGTAHGGKLHSANVGLKVAAAGAFAKLIVPPAELVVVAVSAPGDNAIGGWAMPIGP